MNPKSTYKIIFSSRALKDLQEAKRWYNQQQFNLGNRLIEDVTSVLESIKANPYFASIKFEDIRTAACKTFPYAIHYSIDEAGALVRIISIFHYSRKPYWDIE